MGLFSGFKKLFSGSDDSAKYTGMIQQKESRIASLEKEIAELKTKEEQIALLQREIVNLKEATSKSDATVKAKEDRISGLERTISTLKEKLETANSQPKTETKPEPQKTEPAKVKSPAATPKKPEIQFPDKPQPRPKSAGDDPYQQLGQDLVEALKKTTRREDEESS